MSAIMRKTVAGWGAKVIDRLSVDLHAAFPQMRGFSPRNLGYMKTFANTYPLVSPFNISLLTLNFEFRLFESLERDESGGLRLA
jgi:hypothetical protein